MMEATEKSVTAKLNTYVFVDASNIRAACLKTLGWRPDFERLGWYFADKYPGLQEMRYYEGISTTDWRKRKVFQKLRAAGYKVRSLNRKSYTDEISFDGEIICEKCGSCQAITLTKEVTRLKSNVDVYLATELLEVAYLSKEPVHIILVACDGDYAEMIKNGLTKNKNAYITVIATPVVPLVSLPNGKFKDINSCSKKLQRLRGKKNPRFNLTDIRDIQDYIREQK